MTPALVPPPRTIGALVAAAGDLLQAAPQGCFELALGLLQTRLEVGTGAAGHLLDRITDVLTDPIQDQLAI